jgi:hypothetical protein
VFSRIAVLAAAVAVVAGLTVPAAAASRNLQVGIYDDSQILGNPGRTFPLLRRLRPQIIRVNMLWGGPGGVARRKPRRATDPDDPAYNWGAYDEVVTLAARSRIRVLFSIVGTPGWANGGKRWNRGPRGASDLRAFAYAAATRYSGLHAPDGSDQPLPAVRLWLAWNEPNNPVFLWPQYRRVGRGRYVIQSGRTYARICNAVVRGVKATLLRGEKVGCGVTAPRGNNRARGRRPSVSPLAFLRAMKKGGARGFDAYAHHPYYSGPSERPSQPPSSKTAVTLGNIGDLVRELTRLYGRKRVWITEYGYQTKPPDPFYGVSWRAQARYLAQAFAIARRAPSIDMMLWFLLRDERRARGRDGWQSGLVTVNGRRKPAFRTFQRVRRS